MEQNEVATPQAQKVKAGMPRIDSAIALDSKSDLNGSRKRPKVEPEPETPVCRHNLALVGIDTNFDTSTLLLRQMQQILNLPRNLSKSVSAAR